MLQKYSKAISSLFIGVSSVALLLACRFIAVSPLWGGCFSYFSLTDVLMPLSGLGGFALSLLLFITRITFRSLVLHAGLISIVYHLPGLCASFYWANERLQRAVGIIIPLVCMVLFLVHPVGQGAALYTTFWLIPMIISALGFAHPFYKSLASTFIAHAVGSVIWLYSKALTSGEWLALIPVVIVERFAFAAIMTVAYYFVSYAIKIYKTRAARLYKTH